MKKIYLAAIAVLHVVPFISKTQNIFPPGGNVGIGLQSCGNNWIWARILA